VFSYLENLKLILVFRELTHYYRCVSHGDWHLTKFLKNLEKDWLRDGKTAQTDHPIPD
jgi:hypothetical protein